MAGVRSISSLLRTPVADADPIPMLWSLGKGPILRGCWRELSLRGTCPLPPHLPRAW